jgi:hypothetical protein
VPRPTRPPRVLLVCLLALGPISARGDDQDASARPRLGMTPAVACRAVHGYEDYEPLPDAALTSDEKLIIYYRPTGFDNARDGCQFRAHLTQDGQIRRRDSKAVLFRKEKAIDVELKADRPIENIYIKCLVSLKTLRPGEYSYDIILHDAIGKGPPARQTLKFTVVAARANDGTPRL